MKHGKGIIIGGGIGGLTTAIGLLQLGLDVEVYEAAPELREVGAGIWLAPNAMSILGRLGVANDVMEQGFQLSKMNLRNARMGIITGTDQTYIREKYGFGITAIHRARLVRVLAKHIPEHRIHLGKRLLRVEEKNDKVTAFFEDGSSAIGDYVIGADGIKSKVRNSIFPDASIRYSGQTCWRGIAQVNGHALNGIEASEIWGKGKRFGISRISEEEVYWFACRDAKRGGQDEHGRTKGILMDMFKDFSEPVMTVLRNTSVDKMIRNDLDDLLPLSTWSKGRLLLIGDAAHATTPNLGQGGGQAIEDAWYLHCLMEKEMPLTELFNQFYKLRFKRVNDIVKRSFMMGKIAHMKVGKRIRNTIFSMTPESVINKQFMDMYQVPEKEIILSQSIG